MFLAESLIQTRSKQRWVAPTLRILVVRKKRLPKETIVRSKFVEWNYKAEVYSFGQRLGEDFDQEILTQAFTHPSYIAQEEARLSEVGVEQPELAMKDHRELAVLGEGIVRKYVDAFLRFHLPLFPDPGIVAVKNFLLSTEKLAKIASHMGLKDVILASVSRNGRLKFNFVTISRRQEYPPPAEVLAQTLQAVVGALAKSQPNEDVERAYDFVRDFICTELNQVDVSDLWTVEKPFELLKNVCVNRNIKSIEPRLIGENAKNTIFASCRVAIYDAETKKQLGSGGGENIDNAVDVAAIDALARLFGTYNPNPFNFQITSDELFAASKGQPRLSAGQNRFAFNCSV